MKHLLAFAVLGLFGAAALVGCEASAEIGDDDADVSSHRTTTIDRDDDDGVTRTTTVRESDGDSYRKTTRTEVDVDAD